VSQFKFACPVCGQHLEAGVEEEGRTTECPSCFKKLTVPQAPTGTGTKLIITASLADARRVPATPAVEPGAQPANRPRVRGPALYIVLALLSVLVAAGAIVLVKRGQSKPAPEPPPTPRLWTERTEALRLVEGPVRGSLSGWDFSLTTAVWQDTRLILRQDGRQPEALRLQISFPLQGGELVPGKAFRLGPDDPPFEPPIRILWKAADGTEKSEAVCSKYLLWVEFDKVSKSAVGGRIHLCLMDSQRSWLAGRFSATIRTRVK
jgi:hypothetical protein